MQKMLDKSKNAMYNGQRQEKFDGLKVGFGRLFGIAV